MADRGSTRPAATVALGAAMVLPPLLFNGAFGWSVVVITALALVALGITLAAARTRRGGSMLGFAVVAAFVLTALQAMPLPLAWARFSSPDAAEAALRAADVLGAEPPRFVAFSLDPGGTRERTLAALAIAAAFLAGAMHGSFGRTNVLRLGALSVLVVVTVTLAHLLAGAKEIYGLHALRFAATPVPSPLVNPNHLGGFCAFGAILALGLATEATNVVERASTTVLALISSTIVFATLSRGAMASLAVGVLAFALVHARRSRERSERRAVARNLAAFALVVAMLTTAAFVGIDTIAEELASDEFGKLGVQRRALALAVGSHPLLGIGRGAFYAALAPTLGTGDRYFYPENFVVQWASEWGVPFAAFLLAAVLVPLARVLRRAKSAPRIAGACAIGALGLQNLVDFGLEMVGEAVVVAAVFGALLCERRRARESESESADQGRGRRSADSRMLASFTLASGVLCLAVFGPSVARGGALELEERMRIALTRGDHEAVRAMFATVAPLHPLDPSFPLLAGADATVSGDRSAPQLLNRAMELAPLWPAPHVAASRLLVSHGRVDQAALELRTAEERAPGSAVHAACELLRARPFPRLADRVMPRSDADANRFANELARCLPLESKAAAALDARLLVRAPEFAAPAVRTARRALRSNDPERALAVLEPRAARHRGDVSFVLTLADALTKSRRNAEAVALLENALVEGDGQRRVLEALVLTRARDGDTDGVARAVERLTAHAAGSAPGLAKAALVEGKAEELLGRPHAAIRAYRRADGYDPSSGGLERAARLAERKGNRAQSYQLYSTLCLRGGAGSPACERLHRLHSPPPPERHP